MRSILLSISLLTTAAMASGAVNGTWINHSAIDIDSQITRSSATSASYNYITRMYDTEKYLFILAHGKGYNTLSAGMTKATLLPSYIDKATGRFEALSNKFVLSGQKVEDMTYSPASGILAICYDNKSIDLINANTDELVMATGLATYTTPGGALPGRIQFDKEGKTLTVATNFGFIAFDAETGAITSICKLDENVNMAVKMGDRFLGYSDSGFFTVPVRQSVAATDRTILPIDISGVIGPIDGILPLTDSSFIIVSSTDNYNTLAAYGATLADDAETILPYQLLTEPLTAAYMSLYSYMMTIHPLAGLFWPTNDGVALTGNTNFWMLKYPESEDVFKSASDASAYVAACATKIAKDTSAAPSGYYGNERYQRATTTDGETFWFLRPRHGIIKRHRVATSPTKFVWEDLSEIIEPNMGAALNAHHITYHPELGVLARNEGSRYGSGDFPTNTKYLSDGLCSFKDGKWTRQSVFHKLFNLTGNLPMMWGPRGVAFDPLEPNFLYEVSSEHGLHKMDLNDPSYHLLLSSDADKNKTQPGYLAIFPSQKWPTAGFSLPTFDSKGVMWLNLFTQPSVQGDDYHPTELWYWLPEDRMAVRTPEDYAAHPMKQIKFDHTSSLYNGRNVPLTGPGCENYLLHCPDDYSYTYLYDHGGTLEDMSDDRIALFENPIYENGDAFPTLFASRFAIQDPYDNKVLLATGRGYVVFDPHQAFEPRQVMEWLQPDESDEPSYSPHPLGATNSWGIAIDPLGRKWISTEGEGLYVLSPDRKRVLAQFTEKNSPLSNDLYGIVYNPERNSIMVGTAYGIMEFLHGGSEFGNDVAGAVNRGVSPRSLHPDYQGHISFYGLTDGKYNILSADGEIVDSVEAIGGRADWHPGHLRHLLPPGTYTLDGLEGTELIVL